MHTFVIRANLKGIAPIARHARLDELMESVGFFPWRPGVPPQDQDGASLFSQWEYAGNHSLEAEPLKRLVEGRIKTEIQGSVDVVILHVRIMGSE